MDYETQRALDDLYNEIRSVRHELDKLQRDLEEEARDRKQADRIIRDDLSDVRQ